ncbi:MAG TPA: hypothetical protein VFR32_06325 [Gaiellaceae bacterium]|nr:hypothetical protein [Gaiellaceae bacterium]
MTELDRASLERLLPAMPDPADWDDVLGRSGVQQRRHRLLLVLATVVLAAAATASAFGMRAVFLDKGFIGLPPVGATPSAPESGELEIFYRVSVRAWVYADGRLIWLGGRSDLPESANPLSTGFLEQRLTPDGVELLRSEIAAAGDFGNPDELAPPPGRPPCPSGVTPSEGNCQLPTPEPAPDAPIRVPFHTQIVVAGLGTLVHVDHARDLTRLQARLSDPGSWLPASAWADQDIRAYVATKYGVCYSGWPPDEPVEQSRIVSLFPASTRDLLGSATERQGPLFGSPGHLRPSHEYCFDATTDEARALVAALDAAGFRRKGAVRLNYDILDGGPDPEGALYFEPYLPHGEITCSVCG